MPGARRTRSLVCARVVSMHTSIHSEFAEITRHPHAMVYGLWRALLGDRAVLPPSFAKVAFHKLDASVEASGPHVFTVRFSALVKSTSTSTASRPASVTIASRPSGGTRRLIYVK